MSSKARTLARICLVRTIVRNGAAAEVAGATARAEDARAAVEDATGRAHELLATMASRFERGGTTRIFDHATWEREAREAEVAAADAARREAEALAEARRLALASRERELRVSETLRDRVAEEREARLRREEQAMCDDLAAARRRRIA